MLRFEAGKAVDGRGLVASKRFGAASAAAGAAEAGTRRRYQDRSIIPRLEGRVNIIPNMLIGEVMRCMSLDVECVDCAAEEVAKFHCIVSPAAAREQVE